MGNLLKPLFPRNLHDLLVIPARQQPTNVQIDTVRNTMHGAVRTGHGEGTGKRRTETLAVLVTRAVLPRLNAAGSAVVGVGTAEYAVVVRGHGIFVILRLKIFLANQIRVGSSVENHVGGNLAGKEHRTITILDFIFGIRTIFDGGHRAGPAGRRALAVRTDTFHRTVIRGVIPFCDEFVIQGIHVRTRRTGTTIRLGLTPRHAIEDGQGCRRDLGILGLVRTVRISIRRVLIECHLFDVRKNLELPTPGLRAACAAVGIPRPAARPPGRRQEFVVRFMVDARQCHLLHIITARRNSCRLPRLLHRREQQTHQHPDNRDDHQQLDERKAF